MDREVLDITDHYSVGPGVDDGVHFLRSCLSGSLAFLLLLQK